MSTTHALHGAMRPGQRRDPRRRWWAAADAAPARPATSSTPRPACASSRWPTRSRIGSTSRETTAEPARRQIDRHRGQLLRRPRRLPEAAQDRRQLRDPGRAAGFRPDAHQGGGRGRQEHLRREAGGGGRRRRAQLPRVVRGDEAEGARPGRRHAVPPLHRLPPVDEAHPRRRDRRHLSADGLLQHRASCAEGPPAGVERAREPDAQLALLHLALRRSHRRAAHPQHRRAELDHAAPTRCGPSAPAAGRCAPAPEYGPHLRPLRRSSTSTRTACTAMCRQQNGTDKKVANEVTGTKGRAFMLPKSTSPARSRGSTRASPTTCTSGAHGPDREHPRRQAAQRAEAGGREHARGIMGRKAAYTGDAMTWEQALATPSLMPADARLGADADAAGGDAGRDRVRRCLVGGGARSAPVARGAWPRSAPVRCVAGASGRRPARRRRGADPRRDERAPHGHARPHRRSTPSRSGRRGRRAAPPSLASRRSTRASATTATTARWRRCSRATAGVAVPVSADLFAVLAASRRAGAGAPAAPSTSPPAADAPVAARPPPERAGPSRARRRGPRRRRLRQGAPRSAAPHRDARRGRHRASMPAASPRATPPTRRCACCAIAGVGAALVAHRRRHRGRRSAARAGRLDGRASRGLGGGDAVLDRAGARRGLDLRRRRAVDDRRRRPLLARHRSAHRLADDRPHRDQRRRARAASTPTRSARRSASSIARPATRCCAITRPAGRPARRCGSTCAPTARVDGPSDRAAGRPSSRPRPSSPLEGLR